MVIGQLSNDFCWQRFCSLSPSFPNFSTLLGLCSKSFVKKQLAHLNLFLWLIFLYVTNLQLKGMNIEMRTKKSVNRRQCLDPFLWFHQIKCVNLLEINTKIFLLELFKTIDDVLNYGIWLIWLIWIDWPNLICLVEDFLLLGCYKSCVHFHESTLNCNSINSIESK